MVFNLLHGVQHYYVYLDNRFGDDDLSAAALEPYVTVGLVTVIDWKGRLHLDAYNDCVHQFGSRYQWMAMIDDDKFIVPKSNGSLVCLRELMKPFESAKSVGGVVLRWAYFGSNRHILPLYAAVAPDIFLRRMPSNPHVKAIVRTDRVSYVANPHFSTYKQPYHAVNVNYHVVNGVFDKTPSGYDGMYIAHYWSRSFEEYLAKVSRGQQHDRDRRRPVSDFFSHDIQCTVLDNFLSHTLPPHLVIDQSFLKDPSFPVSPPSQSSAQSQSCECDCIAGICIFAMFLLVLNSS
jgi:hypothetical protein